MCRTVAAHRSTKAKVPSEWIIKPYTMASDSTLRRLAAPKRLLKELKPPCSDCWSVAKCLRGQVSRRSGYWYCADVCLVASEPAFYSDSLALTSEVSLVMVDYLELQPQMQINCTPSHDESNNSAGQCRTQRLNKSHTRLLRSQPPLEPRSPYLRCVSGRGGWHGVSYPATNSV